MSFLLLPSIFSKGWVKPPDKLEAKYSSMCACSFCGVMKCTKIFCCTSCSTLETKKPFLQLATEKEIDYHKYMCTHDPTSTSLIIIHTNTHADINTGTQHIHKISATHGINIHTSHTTHILRSLGHMAINIHTSHTTHTNCI